jgi:hypothetical protein
LLGNDGLNLFFDTAHSGLFSSEDSSKLGHGGS